MPPVEGGTAQIITIMGRLESTWTSMDMFVLAFYFCDMYDGIQCIVC